MKLTIAAAILSLTLGPAVAARPAASEYAVKAAFLRYFASFVEWPAGSVVTNAPIVIGLVGNDPFGPAINEFIEANSVINGHRVSVRRLRWNDSIHDCHIIFISSTEVAHLDFILRTAKELNILTIADVDGFAQRGGIIELRNGEGRVRFDVNMTAAGLAQLRVSSKLLRIARVIHSGGAR